ncbi:unnamed protein product [Lactuca saligna]|uniref:K+ potassium transporter integral membrane domain-containing protein n=1 Tax=Lactuca saligna TaxID=75948 RepID=A0AA35Y8F0_LACSI|nr:unnamed protein product [Lactuca saligna]
MGQIYIPVMNWFLLAVAILLVTFIASTDEIGTAYGDDLNGKCADDIVNKSVWCISFKTWSFMPCFLNLMVQLSSQSNELYQLDAVAFCLLSTWVEPIRKLFAALFLSSIGMLIHVQFLWTHMDILLASVILVIVFKTTVSAVMRKAFGYCVKTSFLMTVKDALNSALVEEMAAGSSIFIMGEEVGEY